MMPLPHGADGGNESPPRAGESASLVTRTSLSAQARNGVLYIFMPPTETLEDYLELIAAVEATAEALAAPVIVEGYEPPSDPRLTNFRVTPDPGVIEVNIQPSASWDELVARTTHLYEAAHLSRLCTEKFMLDGRHTGTGGGNHFVFGGATTLDSPLPAATRPAAQPDQLLAQPSVPFLPLLGSVYRPDQPVATRRRSP
jgi:uncharacterized protein (DUF2126 family)